MCLSLHKIHYSAHLGLAGWQLRGGGRGVQCSTLAPVVLAGLPRQYVFQHQLRQPQPRLGALHVLAGAFHIVSSEV